MEANKLTPRVGWRDLRMIQRTHCIHHASTENNQHFFFDKHCCDDRSLVETYQKPCRALPKRNIPMLTDAVLTIVAARDMTQMIWIAIFLPTLFAR